MITRRTPLLQTNAGTGWQWVFCYNVSRSQMTTTEDYRKALPAGTGNNLTYFEQRGKGARFRAISATQFQKEQQEAKEVAIVTGRPVLEALQAIPIDPSTSIPRDKLGIAVRGGDVYRQALDRGQFSKEQLQAAHLVCVNQAYYVVTTALEAAVRTSMARPLEVPADDLLRVAPSSTLQP